MMKLLLTAFIPIFAFFPGPPDEKLPPVPDNIQCGARNCFNPERWNFYHQWNHYQVTDYVGYEMGCEIKPIKSITSSLRGRSYDGDWLFQYDQQQHLLLQQSQFPSGRTYKIVISYNGAGKPVYVSDGSGSSTIEYPAPGKSILKLNQIIRTTQMKGNTITQTTTRLSGDLDNKIVKVFDQQKRLVSQTDSFTYNHSKTIYTYEYNKKGLVSKININYGKEIITKYREYNEYGWVILDSTVIGPQNSLVFHYKYEVTAEAHGMTIQQLRLNTDSAKYPLIYSFDKWGNWYDMKEYSSLLPLKTETRKITYW